MKDTVFPILVVLIIVSVKKELVMWWQGVVFLLWACCTDSFSWVFRQRSSTGYKSSQEESREIMSLLTLRLWSQGIKGEQEHLLSKGSSEVSLGWSQSQILAVCCLGEAPLDEVCIKHCTACLLPPMWRKKLFRYELIAQSCSPWKADWKEGNLPGSYQLPGKCHILLPPGITEIYEAVRLRHSFSIFITPTLASY